MIWGIGDIQFRILRWLVTEGPITGYASAEAKACYTSNPEGVAAHFTDKRKAPPTQHRINNAFHKATPMLERRGFVTVGKVPSPTGRGRAWNKLSITSAGREAWSRIDTAEKRLELHKALRKKHDPPQYTTWHHGMEPGFRWKRWTSRLYGWLALLEYHPTARDGENGQWQYKLKRPDNQETAWIAIGGIPDTARRPLRDCQKVAGERLFTLAKQWKEEHGNSS